MKKSFSKTWNSSIQPRKQRKYRHKAPLHLKKKYLAVTLSKDLRAKHAIRSIRVKKGDEVKITVGDYKGKQGKVSRVSVKYLRVYIENVLITKKDGSKKALSVDPSNLIITSLDLNDKKRAKKIERSKSQISKA